MIYIRQDILWYIHAICFTIRDSEVSDKYHKKSLFTIANTPYTHQAGVQF